MLIINDIMDLMNHKNVIFFKIEMAFIQYILNLEP